MVAAKPGVNGGRGESYELNRALRLRHLIMLSVGGTIASGFFLFIGSAIQISGPSVVLSYVIAGFISILVMACLAEMAVDKPVSGSFAVYCRDAMGRMPGFLTGWNYWLAWVMGGATESVAAGTYIHSFYPQVPVWVVAFGITAMVMTVNLIGVLFMGEYEFILSTVKIIVLGMFILLGILAILSVGFEGAGVKTLSAHGGFFPNGGGAVLTSLMTVFFAYVGIELVGVAAEESVRPEHDVPAALIRTALLIAVLFAIGSFVLMAIIPWTEAGVSSSPFVDALKDLNLPVIAAIFNWVIIVASISSVDGGLYTSSRMFYAMAREGHFPRFMSRTHRHRRTPNAAIAASATVMFVGALLAYLSPSTAYIWVASLSTFGFLYAWLMIALSQFILRKKMSPAEVAELKWRVPLYPITPILAIVAVLGAFVGQFFIGGSQMLGPFSIPGFGIAVVVGLIWTAIWVVYYFAVGNRFRHGDEWRAMEEVRLLPETPGSEGADQ